jgi:hypothetical protein
LTDTHPQYYHFSMDTNGERQPPVIPAIPTRPVPIKAANQATPSNGYKISVLFGDQILQAGFTSVPNLVLNHYAELGITPAEMMFIIHMWQFRWTERDPYPSLTTIADKMDVSWRQAHRYAKSLEQKGFLIIKSRQEPGRGQVTSEYDFEPLLKAVLKLDKGGGGNPSTDKTGNASISGNDGESTPLTTVTGGGMTDLTEAPLTQLSDEEYKEQEDTKQKDVNHSNIREAQSLESEKEALPTGSNAYKQPDTFTVRKPRAREQGRGDGFSSIGATLTRSTLRLPPKPYGEERQVIMDYVARFAKEFNDHASLKTSTTRAYNLFVKSKLPLGGFIGRMYEAQAITKESAAAVLKRRNPGQPGGTGIAPRGRPAKNKMAYWFSVLEDRLGLRKARGSVQ